jgi:hypothetical protein
MCTRATTLDYLIVRVSILALNRPHELAPALVMQEVVVRPMIGVLHSLDRVHEAVSVWSFAGRRGNSDTKALCEDLGHSRDLLIAIWCLDPLLSAAPVFLQQRVDLVPPLRVPRYLDPARVEHVDEPSCFEHLLEQNHLERIVTSLLDELPRLSVT